jgi:hypothetical protein
MSDVMQTYTLQILRPEETPAEEGSAFGLEQQEKRLAANLPAMLEDLLENLNDVLPEGFAARLLEWDH